MTPGLSATSRALSSTGRASPTTPSGSQVITGGAAPLLGETAGPSLRSRAVPTRPAAVDAHRARPSATTIEADLEAHRRELTGYCYRMLASGFEAEDAVQETMVRAWRNIDRFEGRSALRSWLYRIATNVCLDMLTGRERRARPMDLGAAKSADSPLGIPLVESAWIEPIPDARVAGSSADPAELSVQRETIRLAFI